MEISATVSPRTWTTTNIPRFEARLGSVFNHLHSIYASFDGRIKADNFRRQVMAVTSVWEQWLVFNNTNVEGWIKTFLGRVEEDRQSKEEEVEEKVVEKPVEKKGKWKSVTAKTEVESVVPPGETSLPLNAPDDSEIEDVDGKTVEEDDVDGKPMEEEEDVDGEPMEQEDVDGEPMEEEDVDGVPMDDDEDVDGEPMEEEDIDGLPMDEPVPPAETLPISPRPGSPHQSPHRQEKSPTAEILPPLEAPRPQKRQRMRAADMFND